MAKSKSVQSDTTDEPEMTSSAMPDTPEPAEDSPMDAALDALVQATAGPDFGDGPFSAALTHWYKGLTAAAKTALSDHDLFVLRSLLEGVK